MGKQMKKETVEKDTPQERHMTDEERRKYRELMRKSTFGHLDDYFSMMMSFDEIGEEEKAVYELAVRAFINDISHNGLPKIRRERYNREFKVECLTFGLINKCEEMMNTKREYHP